MLIESFKSFLQKQRNWKSDSHSLSVQILLLQFCPLGAGRGIRHNRWRTLSKVGYLSSLSLTHEEEEFLLFFCFHNNNNVSWHARNNHRRGLTHNRALRRSFESCLRTLMESWIQLFLFGDQTFFRESLSLLNNNNNNNGGGRWFSCSPMIGVYSLTLSSLKNYAKLKFLHFWWELLKGGKAILFSVKMKDNRSFYRMFAFDEVFFLLFRKTFFIQRINV